MIVEMIFPMVFLNEESGWYPKYLFSETGQDKLYRWEAIEQFDKHGPSWRMRVRLYTDDPAVLGRLRAKPDVEEEE